VDKILALARKAFGDKMKGKVFRLIRLLDKGSVGYCHAGFLFSTNLAIPPDK